MLLTLNSIVTVDRMASSTQRTFNCFVTLAGVALALNTAFHTEPVSALGLYVPAVTVYIWCRPAGVRVCLCVPVGSLYGHVLSKDL